MQGQRHTAGLLFAESTQRNPQVPHTGSRRIQRGEVGQNARQISPTVHLWRQEATKVH